jgi:uncharacterized protein YbjT (DUF2867 family)
VPGIGHAMRVLLFGATGMIGQGVLRECLLATDVHDVLSIVRGPTGRHDPTLRELTHLDFLDFSAIDSELSGFDACFFCLGVSSAGMSEARYTRVTYDITMAAARTVATRSPDVTFVYVSGMGADSSERGRIMWARVKGRTENALLRLPVKAAYMFRPGAVVPMHGVKSKTRIYRWLYTAAEPLLPLLQAWLPRYVTTTEQVGRAMLEVTRRGASTRILECSDINHVGS